MKLLHVAPASGSFTVLLLNRLSALSGAGHQQWALSTSEHGADPNQALADVGVDYIESQALSRDFDLMADARFAVEVFRLVRELQPDITITYGPKPGAIARPASRLAGSRVVHMHWGNVFDDDSSPLHTKAFELIDAISGYFSSDVCVENRVDFARLQSSLNPWTNFRLIGNGTDVDHAFNPDRVDRDAVSSYRAQLLGSPDEVLVLLVGRVVVDKGYREYFEAARRITERRPEHGLRFGFVGRQDEARGLGIAPDTYDDLVADKLLCPIGHVPHNAMPAIISAADIIVLPSYREGFPRSLVEAAALGKPIVATDIAGCREVVEHESNGMLVRPRDVSGLADAIERLAFDPDLRARFGFQSRKMAVERFNEQKLIAEVNTVLMGSSKGDRR